jgi:hypothetical protein
MLASYVSSHQKDWDLFLPYLSYAYNTAVHDSTQTSPFELTYGRKPKVPVDLIFPNIELDLHLSPASYAAEVQRNLQDCFNRVISCRDTRMERNKVEYDRSCRAANFGENDFVWVLDTTTKVGVSKKLSRKWKGPYRILDKINKVNYRIQPIQGRGRKLIVHQNRLMKCYTRDMEKFNESLLTSQLESDFSKDISFPLNNEEREDLLVWPDINVEVDVLSVSSEATAHSSASASTECSNLSEAITELLEDIVRCDVSVDVNSLSFDDSVQVRFNDEVDIIGTPTSSPTVSDHEQDEPFTVNQYYRKQIDNSDDVPVRKGSRVRKAPTRLGY